MPAVIAAAIKAVMSKVKTLPKDDRNEFAKYNYASADKFFEVIGPLQADAGLILLQNQADWEIKAVGTRHLLFIDFDFYLTHETGAMWAMPLRRTVNVDAGGAQAWGQAQTYALKQLQRSLFLVPTGEADADAQETHTQAVPTRRTAAPIPPEVFTVDPIEDYVGNFLTALAHKTTPEDAADLLRQFREGPGKRISAADKKRCAAAYETMMEKMQRYKADG